jgi:hypothetical protein
MAEKLILISIIVAVLAGACRMAWHAGHWKAERDWISGKRWWEL